MRIDGEGANEAQESLNGEQHCPFSKPLFGRCCQCPHAEFADQRTRRVNCTQKEAYLLRCLTLDEMLLGVSYALPGMESLSDEPSFSQLMKSRCGGMSGIKRVLDGVIEEAVVVPDLVAAIENRFGRIEAFPFGEISSDILSFATRRKKSR